MKISEVLIGGAYPKFISDIATKWEYISHSARRSSNIILFAFFPHQAQNIP